MRLASRVDSCHSEVGQAFLNCGWDAFDTSRMGGGFPDWLVHKNGRLALIECKSPNGKIRLSQMAFAIRFPVTVIRSAAEAYAFCGIEHVGEGVAS